MSADITLTWFDNNQMKVNPEKFQTFGCKKGKRGEWYRPEHIRTDDKTNILCKIIRLIYKWSVDFW